ncbi:MAG: lamin tail domain-containing protein [candidate division WOR-3 bacterium]|nr:lamin tail domain-containing protein [candidate division WOR-3 bacterium]MDW8151061.1 lamin tail domain-containing protein [candidate division WOR-3 bacterium]
MLKVLISIIINEVMNYPISETCGEYVELYNPSDDTIFLNGFRIADGEDIDFIFEIQNPPNNTFSRLYILPKEYALIIDRDYLSNCPINYNLFGNILTTEDNSIGNGLSKTDSIYILNQSNDTISKFQKPITNISQGYSVERINFQIDEWGQSLILNGTPNYQNSIFSNSIIKLDSAYLTLSQLKIKLKNLSNESYIQEVKVISGDTFLYQVQIPQGGSYEISINLNELKSPKIELVSNDFSEYIYVPIYYPIVVLNEIEYDLGPEWIEIYNVSNTSIDLSKFYLKDLSGNIVNLKGTVQPYSYKVFRADSLEDFITLNDNYESLVLYSRFGFIFDSVYYSSSYGGKGNLTLEKVNPSLKGYLKESFKSSLVEYGTPNRLNSVYISDSSLNLDIFVSNKRVRKGEIITISAYLYENTDVEVLLFDNIGRLISKLYSAENTNRIVFNLNTNNLSSGIYILLVKSPKKSKKTYFRIVD